MKPHPDATVGWCWCRRRLLALVAVLAWVAPAASTTRAEGLEFPGRAGDAHVTGSERVVAIGLPLRWSEPNNVVWRMAIPHTAGSTPVVMDGRVWITTATNEGHAFYALGLVADTTAP
jgi:hypothetical protein